MDVGVVSTVFGTTMDQTSEVRWTRAHEARVGAEAIRACRTSTKSLSQPRAAMEHARNERMMGHDRQGVTHILLRQAAIVPHLMAARKHGQGHQVSMELPHLRKTALSSVRTSFRNGEHRTRLKLLHKTRMIPLRDDPLSAARGRVSGPDCERVQKLKLDLPRYSRRGVERELEPKTSQKTSLSWNYRKPIIGNTFPPNDG